MGNTSFDARGAEAVSVEGLRLRLADCRQALHDAKTSADLAYEAERAFELMGNAIDALRSDEQRAGPTSDSDNYDHTFYGILNKQGEFWTPLPFHDEDAALAHLKRFAIGDYKDMLDTHKIVPVCIRLSLAARDAPKGEA